MPGRNITLFLELGIAPRERNYNILHGDLRFNEESDKNM